MKVVWKILAGLFLFVIFSLYLIKPTLPKEPGPLACDKVGAEKFLDMASDPHISTAVINQNGTVVVVFGSDFDSWTTDQADKMVSMYADADACIQERARDLMFLSPSGNLVGYANHNIGIKTGLHISG